MTYLLLNPQHITNLKLSTRLKRLFHRHKWQPVGGTVRLFVPCKRCADEMMITLIAEFGDYTYFGTSDVAPIDTQWDISSRRWVHKCGHFITELEGILLAESRPLPKQCYKCGLIEQGIINVEEIRNMIKE